jgi:hypothetical protein
MIAFCAEDNPHEGDAGHVGVITPQDQKDEDPHPRRARLVDGRLI